MAAQVGGLATSGGVLLRSVAARFRCWRWSWAASWRVCDVGGVAVAADRAIFVSGITTAFGTYPAYTAVLWRYHPNGTQAWRQTLGVASPSSAGGSTRAFGVAVDPRDDHIYLAGSLGPVRM